MNEQTVEILIENAAKKIIDFHKDVSKDGKKFLFIVQPSKEDVYSKHIIEKLPKEYRVDYSQLREKLLKKLDDKFPILVKWLDCSDRLSLQVHPPASIAKSLNGEPKTENWYIANANPNAGLFAGLKNGTTKEDFAKSLKNGQAEKHATTKPTSEDYRPPC